MWFPNKWLVFSLTLKLCYLVLLTASENPSERFEYTYSFKPPYLAQKDGSVPFWEYGGSKYREVQVQYLSIKWYNIVIYS